MNRHSEVLVVGGGPAGLAAAAAAGQAGAKVALVDDSLHPGGRIWQRSIASRVHPDRSKRSALASLAASRAAWLPGRRVVDAPEPKSLRAFLESTGEAESFTWDRLVIATGARERLLPFPGWTLPGVFGAGGLQALVRSGFSVAGKRVVVAGSGPLLLAVAAHLQESGAKIVAIAEQSSLKSLLTFAAALRSEPGKLWQAAQLRSALWRVPYRTGCWPIAAEGEGSLRALRLTDGRKTWTELCDLLACGFHLVPNTELAALLGCTLADGFVAVDAQQRTSTPEVFCAGEPTAIGGLDAALIQGRIAGLGAAGKSREAASLARRATSVPAFAGALKRAFALRPELRSLASAETIVCRCEDVTYGQLQAQASWTEAKLQTRCGMGPCQGRICGPAVETLFGWRQLSVRAPLFPIPLAALTSNSRENNHKTPLEETA